MQLDTSTPMAILSFDYEGNISTFSPELLSFTHPVYGRFTFGNVFDSTLEDVLTHAKFVDINSSIQRVIDRCRESCEYFSLCGGGIPSNKLHENGTFDSSETNACRLRIKVTTDVLLDYLEERYYISSNPLSDLEGSQHHQRNGASSLSDVLVQRINSSICGEKVGWRHASLRKIPSYVSLAQE